MSDKEKKRFQEMAERDKERFDSEMKNYEPTEPQGKGTKRKQIKDPNAPKRPLNAYFMWVGLNILYVEFFQFPLIFPIFLGSATMSVPVSKECMANLLQVKFPKNLEGVGVKLMHLQSRSMSKWLKMTKHAMKG